MPPRLSKRQQRELEELEALGRTAIEPESLDDDETVKKSGLFAAASLLTHEEDDQSEDEMSARKSKKPKKKKKKPVGGSMEQEAGVVDKSALPPAPPLKPQFTEKSVSKPEVKEILNASERKALKKARQKEKKAKEDEIDKALAELSIQRPSERKTSKSTSHDHSLANLLGVSLQHLDAEAELRKFFGSRVVQATKTSTSSSSSSSRRNAGVLRSNLTRPQPTWWSASQREGLSIRSLTADEIQEKLKRHDWDMVDEKWWTIEYSKKYRSMTKAFIQTVMSGDPQGFWNLLTKLPWHADTLLQVAEVYRHREEYAQAVDFVDRALFTYERSFIGAFNLASGTNRLDFDRVENRPFFLAVHRQVADLQRRGCVRTGFEFARLLYSLDPWTDPHGALLHLEYASIRGNMAQWLIDVYELFDAGHKEDADSRMNPSLLPGWAYSRALALRVLEKDSNHAKSADALMEAIKDFPSVVPLLADKLEVGLSASIRGHPDCKIATDASSMSYPKTILHLLSHLYAQRSFSLWKEHTSWFVDTVLSTFASLPSSSLPVTRRHKAFLTLYEKESLRYSVYRHVMVMETTYRNLFSFIPRYVFQEKSLACDPLPPLEAITKYNDAFFEGAEDLFGIRTRSRREIALDERRLAQMIPDAGFRQQLQAFFDAAGLEDRFPGGIIQFAQAAAQLPPEELDNLLLNGLLEVGGEGNPIALAEGGMPGQMPGMQGMLEGDFEEERGALPPHEHAEHHLLHNPDDDESEVGEEDDDEEEEEISPMPRIIRNLLGRLWGHQALAEESSDSEQDNPADLNTVD